MPPQFTKTKHTHSLTSLWLICNDWEERKRHYRQRLRRLEKAARSGTKKRVPSQHKQQQTRLHCSAGNHGGELSKSADFFCFGSFPKQSVCVCLSSDTLRALKCTEFTHTRTCTCVWEELRKSKKNKQQQQSSSQTENPIM